MSVSTDKERIDAILDRGVITDILPSKEAFREKLLRGERIRMYIGADPTSPSLHLSHAKNFMLMEDFRALGHEAIVLVGDFTARIGDPSDEASERKALTRSQVKENMSTWLSQIDPVIQLGWWGNAAKIVYNSSWLSRLRLEHILELASHFTVQHILERDMFEKRMKKGDPVHMHEFLYPLMQGYDSVALNVDVEICGTDQTFNALAGRTLLKREKNKEKFVVITNLMENPATGEIMSKSKGTGVFLDTSAKEMYGAIMAQPDEMIEVLLINNTRLPLEEVGEIKKAKNKRDAKMRTAREIVTIFHGEGEAKKAEEYFVNTFQKKETPEDMPEVRVREGESLADTLVKNKLVESKNEFRRLLEEGAIKNVETNEKLTDDTINKTMTLKIGKKRFVTIVV